MADSLVGLWRHYKGSGVCVFAEGFIERDMVPCVIYTESESGLIFVRPKAEFLEVVPGTDKKRFERCRSSDVRPGRDP